MYTKVGTIINTHGIQGVLKVKPYTFDLNRFTEYKGVFVGENKQLHEIIDVNYHKGFVLLKLSDIESIDEAETIKGKDIFIESKDEAILPEGQYYLHDLLGMNVYDTDGNELGKIVDITQGYGNDIYTIKGKRNGDIPAVKEFILSVDVENKKMTVKLIKGLLDEN